MKINKISLITLLAAGGLLALGTNLRAQDGDAKEKSGDKPQRPRSDMAGGGGQGFAAKMAEELKLTDDQKAKIKAANDEQREKRQAIREDANLTQEQKREKTTALREETNKKMKEILTPEQFEKWEKMRQQGGPRQGGPGGPQGEKKSKDDEKKKEGSAE